MIWYKKALIGLAAMAVGAVSIAVGANAGGGGLPPGEYTFTNTSANAFFGVSKGGPGPAFSVYVNSGMNSFQPEDGDGSPVVRKGTILNLQFLAAGVPAWGCFEIPAADFKVSENLQSAELHTTVTAADVCKGVGKAFSAIDGAPSIAAGAGGTPLPLPLKVDVIWTGLGVTGTGRSTSTFECGDYSLESTNLSHSAGATASGSISALSETFTSQWAGVRTDDSRLSTSGAPQRGCFG